MMLFRSLIQKREVVGLHLLTYLHVWLAIELCI